MWKYDKTPCDYADYDCLLSLRKDMINKRVLAYQDEILQDIIAFNDILTEALREMYDRAHRIWDFIKDNKDFGEEPEVTAKCLLGYDYPELHPVQCDDRQDLWNALCDSGWNHLYENGVTMSALTLPRDDEEKKAHRMIIESFITLSDQATKLDEQKEEGTEGLSEEEIVDESILNENIRRLCKATASACSVWLISCSNSERFKIRR